MIERQWWGTKYYGPTSKYFTWLSSYTKLWFKSVNKSACWQENNVLTKPSDTAWNCILLLLIIHTQQIIMYNYLMTKSLVDNHIEKSVRPTNLFVKRSWASLEKHHSIILTTAIYWECSTDPKGILTLPNLRKDIIKGLIDTIFLQGNQLKSRACWLTGLDLFLIRIDFSSPSKWA